jgi:hypothetical protein
MAYLLDMEYIKLVSFLNDNRVQSRYLVHRVLKSNDLRVNDYCDDLEKTMIHKDDAEELLSLLERELCKINI